ncbi:MAG TPA: hypothetical protein EYP59_09720 [Thiotrichaceae bacterium]|nr:hypothetical protein [Thiotrichaceae bacterium]
MTKNNVSSSQSIILDLDNWIRQGSGKIFQFMATDEQLIEILHASLPTQFAPYSILATFMSKEGKIYKQSSFSVQLPDFLPKKHQGLWQFFIQSHVLCPDLPISEVLQLDRLFAFNGLINLQHGRLSKGVCQKSSIGVVEQLKNLNTGELLKYKESVKIFNALKKALQNALKKEAAFERPKVLSRNTDYPDISVSQITSASR